MWADVTVEATQGGKTFHHQCPLQKFLALDALELENSPTKKISAFPRPIKTFTSPSLVSFLYYIKSTNHIKSLISHTSQ